MAAKRPRQNGPQGVHRTLVKLVVLDYEACEAGARLKRLNQISQLLVFQTVPVQVDFLQNVWELFEHFGQTIAHFWRNVVLVERQLQVYYFKQDREAQDFLVRTLQEISEHLILHIITDYGRLFSLFANVEVVFSLSDVPGKFLKHILTVFFSECFF